MDHPPEVAADEARSRARPLVMVPAFVAASLVGGQLPSFSVAANLYILLVGGALMWLGLSGRVARRRAPGGLDGWALWWLMPAVALAGVELVNFGLGSTDAHPTLSQLADPVLEGAPARSVAYFAWLSAFWGLVRR